MIYILHHVSDSNPESTVYDHDVTFVWTDYDYAPLRLGDFLLAHARACGNHDCRLLGIFYGEVSWVSANPVNELHEHVSPIEFFVDLDQVGYAQQGEPVRVVSPETGQVHVLRRDLFDAASTSLLDHLHEHWKSDLPNSPYRQALRVLAGRNS